MPGISEGLKRENSTTASSTPVGDQQYDLHWNTEEEAVRDAGFLGQYEQMASTLIILTSMVVLPFVGILFLYLWQAYQHACDKCEQDNMANMSMETEYRLKHECCKAYVAPILYPLDPDFNFRHSCGKYCKGPAPVTTV